MTLETPLYLRYACQCNYCHYRKFEWSHDGSPIFEYPEQDEEIMTTTEPETRYVYGWGRTKHIMDESSKNEGWRQEQGLCGAYGGYGQKQPQRPICKRCEKKAAKRSTS